MACQSCEEGPRMKVVVTGWVLMAALAGAAAYIVVRRMRA